MNSSFEGRGWRMKLFHFNPICVNTYLLIDESRQAVVIDCGCLSPDENAQFQQYISDEKLTIVRVLNTHLHLDHVFGNHMLAQIYGVLPDAHEADNFLADRTVSDAAFFCVPGEVYNQSVGNFLHDGDQIEVGNIRLRVIHTPGHTPGGVCFYAEADKVIFTGDTLFWGSCGRTDLPGGDANEIFQSICNRLLTLPDDVVVYPGHALSTTIGRERRNYC